MSRMPASLSRELLGSFVVLLAAALLLAAISLTFVLPVLPNSRAAAGFMVALVMADLLVVGLFGSWILRNRLVRPVQRMEEDVARIAAGEAEHRLGPMPAEELERIRVGVNAMADRLVHDQERLAENVASLDRTNLELLEARDQVLQAARLATAGTLSAGIAHEVGNPLGAIVAYVDVAKRRLDKGTLDAEILDAIRGEAKRIDRIIRTLLDYARPATSPDEAEPVPVNATLERVRDFLGHQGRLSGVELVWEVPETLPRVRVHPQALEQVLVNLLLNAADAVASTEGPRIGVRAGVERGRAAALPPRREGDPEGVDYGHRRRIGGGRAAGDPLVSAARVVVIQVWDNGPGVTEEARGRIFDPFFTTKEPGKGTGLGLSISAGLAEGMGGRLELVDSPEGGAKMVLRLPAIRGGDDAA
jgi:hypothetical protein